jgi:N6-L-threonylcarbamoyladenine synthase
MSGVILAVESSCDESALALWVPGQGLTHELVSTQTELHRKHGGVVPDLASREHLTALPLLLRELLPKISEQAITTIAVTRGPGLLPCLSMGLSFARALSLSFNAQLIGVNHLRAHVHSTFINLYSESPAQFFDIRAALLPHLAMVVSGGNTLLVSLEKDLSMRVIARTVDDAAGEAFDKGARLLGLPYPGGALVEAKAESGDPLRFAFPRGIPERADLRLSFSGLKTALRYQLEKMNDQAVTSAMPDLCAGYQEAIIAQLESKFKAALEAGNYRSAGLSGGVANNRKLRLRLERTAQSHGIRMLIAQPKHCGDNAGMIAFAAMADAGLPEGARVTADPSLIVESV